MRQVEIDADRGARVEKADRREGERGTRCRGTNHRVPEQPEQTNAQRFAVAVAAELTGRSVAGVDVWAAGVVPAVMSGYIEYVGVVAVCAGRPRVLALAYELAPLGVCTVALADHPGGGARFCHDRLASDDARAGAVGPLADHIVAWQTAHPDDTSALDAAFRIRFALAHEAAEPGSIWFVSCSSDERAWASVEIGTADHDHFAAVYLEHVGGGLSIRVAGADLERTVIRVRELDDLLPAVVAGVKAQLAARARFRSRAYRAGMAAQAIAAGLADVAAPGGAPWRWRAVDGAWPTPAPWAAVYWGSEEHTVVTLREQDGAVCIAAGVTDDRPSRPLEVTAATAAELATALPSIAGAVARRVSRLTPDRLATGERYRARAGPAPGSPLAAGAVYVLDGRQYIPYDGATLYSFRADGGETVVHIRDDDAAAEALFRDLDLYLARAD